MRLLIRHSTEYKYATPCRYAIQTLRLTPRPHDGLAIRRWHIKGEGRRELPEHVDGYGNIVHTHTVDHMHSEATILVEGEVETRDTNGVLSGLAETLPPGFYLRSTALTEPDEALRLLAHEAREDTALATSHRLMMAIRDRIDYKTGESEVTTSAAGALAAGLGVCQDHAHVFVSAARVLNIPARYISGYLCATSDGAEDSACHAWAEAYIEDLGWVGFDPANRICPGEFYVRLACGLDYGEAAPVRGLRREGGDEELTVQVQVRQQSQQ